MSDSTVDVVWFTLMFLLLVVSCVGAFFSFIWLAFAAASGTGLMPWLIIFPMSLVGVWVSAGQVGL
jgi:hypothetical protein